MGGYCTSCPVKGREQVEGRVNFRPGRSPSPGAGRGAGGGLPEPEGGAEAEHPRAQPLVGLEETAGVGVALPLEDVARVGQVEAVGAQREVEVVEVEVLVDPGVEHVDVGVAEGADRRELDVAAAHRAPLLDEGRGDVPLAAGDVGGEVEAPRT